jgi:tRNA (guanine37-N1)-methyltransferase
MKIDIITIFPEFFDSFLNTSIIKRAIEENQVIIKAHQLRDFSKRKHQYIDDTPYGGGVGMLMQFPPFYEAIHHLKSENAKVIMLSPQGKLFNQEIAKKYAKEEHVILLCGHYEGIDARVENFIDDELSIGDYVLTGGEIPAMIFADAVTRLLPGVIHEESSELDSLQNGWLKYPQYTKPESYKGFDVPEILRSGHHGNIEIWRKEQSVKRTMLKRPDLFSKIELTEEEKKIVHKIKTTLP